MTNHELLTFGPVPSRRLGRSLGINNIPPKVCTYSCIYCQVGRTLNMQTERRVFYKPEEILRNVEKKVKAARDKEEPIDYLTFVPDGEPTLDINLGKEIELLKPLGIKIAVISNASLIWQEDVRDDLCKADWVSLKIDAVSEDIWHRVNRPHKSLQLDEIFQGIIEFSRTFKGKLATETMLIKDINDNTEEIGKIVNFVAGLKDAKSYISIPTRPPAETWVEPATEHTINTAYQLFKEKSIDVEYLIGYEGNAFAFTGNIEKDLLSITSVHPMRKEAVDEFLKKANGNWAIIEKLISENKLIETEYKNNKFYIRKLVKINNA
ncbi:MAG: radical SAM protein [Candidatus Omnitrophica bacterium]|nr:radical SAM protein [Candidatus Omnitrophota bacterium]